MVKKKKEKLEKIEDKESGYQEAYNVNPFDIESMDNLGSISTNIISEISNHKNIIFKIFKKGKKKNKED